MALDIGRQTDLEEVAAMVKAAQSAAEREHYEKLFYRITNQSTEISSLRAELIAAMRVRDVKAISRISQHIQAVRLEETRGSSWGQNKGERVIL